MGDQWVTSQAASVSEQMSKKCTDKDEEKETRDHLGSAETGSEIGGRVSDWRVVRFPEGISSPPSVCAAGQGKGLRRLGSEKELRKPIGMRPRLSVTLQEYPNTQTY